MKDFLIGTLWAAIFMYVIMSGVILGGLKHEIKTLKQEAITLGFAQYNPTNAVWQWTTNR